MKPFTRRTSIRILTLFIASQTLLACADASQTADTTDTHDTAAQTEAVTETTTVIPDGLPEADLDGAQFRMLIEGEALYRDQTYIDTESGSIVDDAVYHKIRDVEERFNVDVVLSPESDSATGELTSVKNGIIAGDDLCDILQGHDITMANLALQGYFLNVYDIPHFDFSKPWWSKATLESMTVADQMYMMFNNISYNNLACTRAIFFNKGLLDSLDIAYPYEDVYNGTWTLDRFYALSSQGYHDLNGNGKTDADDRFGFVNPTYYYCFLEPFQVEPYQRDKDGNLIYQTDIEKLSTLTQKFYNLLFTEGGFLAKPVDTLDAGALTFKCFTEHRSMFIYASLQNTIPHVSDSDVIYGILPMPKYDELQTEYYGGSTDRPIAVPITAEPHLEKIGLVAEALNAEGYKQVYPAYYEIAMKTRYADQTDDAKMLDLIHQNLIISFTYLYGNYSSVYNIMFENLFNGSSPSTDVASWCAKNEKSQIKHVEKLQEFFDENRP